MALVPHKITALAENDSEGGGSNVVAGAVVSLYDNEGSAVTLFDNESGANGSTAKTTDSSGQVVVWVTPGEYSEAVNGSTLRKIVIGGNNPTDVPTLSELEMYRPFKTGQAFICQGLGNAKFILQSSSYAARPGDVTFANGRKGELQLTDSALVTWFGAAGDAVYSETGNISSGSNVLTDPTASFSSSDVGKLVNIYNAGVSPARLNTTITAVNSATQVTLASSATASPPAGAAKYVYGTDNTSAINNALQMASEKSVDVIFPSGGFLVNSALNVYSGTRVSGKGKGSTVIYHPQTSCFTESAAGVSDIVIEYMSGNACASADGFVAMSGASSVTVNECAIVNTKNIGVTVGVGFDKVAGIESTGFRVTNCDFDVADYGVVFDSSTGNGLLSDCKVTGCTINTYWGSGVSISGHVQDVSIDNCKIKMYGIAAEDAGSGGATAGQGIGVKIWNGTSTTVRPKNINISNYRISGDYSGNTFQGVSCNNYGSDVVIGSGTFEGVLHCVFTNFSNTADGLTVDGAVARECGWLFYNDNSSDYSPLITNFQVIDCDYGIRTSLRNANISNGRFSRIANYAITLNNPCRFGRVAECTFNDIGESCVIVPTNGTNSQMVMISGNNMTNVCNKADNTYDAIDLNDQAHSVVGNIIQSDGSNRPRYIIGGTGTNRLINSNWMFGGTAYLETAAAGSDVYIGNKERGL